jgi:D-arabinose 1-dehydrogenase-like Zn-dependent alcohol dehydrogenase
MSYQEKKGMPMRAMILNAYGDRLVMSELPVPIPGPGELLVQVKASGLCGTDLKIIQGKLNIGPLPHILGHEIAGVVAGCGSDSDREWIRRRVALHLYCACGKCKACRAGEYNLCDDLPGRLGFELPGGLAEYVICPLRCAVVIPEGISFEEACVAPCAMLTIYHALNRAKVTAADKVALLGVGGLGIHGVQFLSSMGVEVTAVDVVDKKLAYAQKLGAAFVLTYDQFMANGKQYDVLVDMIGRTDSARKTFNEKLKRHGRYMLISFLPGAENAFDAQHMAMDECQIIGIRNGTIQELRQTLELQGEGKIKPVIDCVLPLAHTNQALDLIRQGKLMGRVVVSHEDD